MRLCSMHKLWWIAKKPKGSNAPETSVTRNTWTALRCYLCLLGSCLSVYTQTVTYCFVMKHCTWLVGGIFVPSSLLEKGWTEVTIPTHKHLQHIARFVYKLLDRFSSSTQKALEEKQIVSWHGTQSLILTGTQLWLYFPACQDNYST